MKSKKVGPHNTDSWQNPLPDANPELAIREIERRRTVASRPRPTLTPEEIEAEKEANKLQEKLRLQAKFIKERSGYCVVNFANEQFSTRCPEPNFRILSIHPAASNSPSDMAKAEANAKAAVIALMADPRMTSVPVIIEANVPTPIPFSEQSALLPRHLIPKRDRNLTRHAEMVELRTAEFNRRVNDANKVDRSTALESALEGKAPVYPTADKNSLGLGASEYHRRKTYLKKREEAAAAKAAPAEPASTPSEHSTRALPAFGQGAIAGAGAGVGAGAPTPDANTTLRDVMAAASSTLDKALARREEFGLRPEEPEIVTTDIEALPEVAETLFTLDSLPSHWRKPSTDKPVSADSLPADLQPDGQNFAAVTFLDDLDTVEDTPGFPEAAGMEPLVIIYGGAFESVEETKAFITNELGRWCTDLPIDVVDTGKWLFPTAVDPDKLKEEHRVSNNPALTQELQTIMDQRKKTQAQTAEARANAAAAGVPLYEVTIDPDADVPDVSAVETYVEKGMFLQGPVVQLNKDGEVQTSSSAPEDDDLPDLEDLHVEERDHAPNVPDSAEENDALPSL